VGYSQTRAPLSAANEFHLARCAARRDATRRGAARRGAARRGAARRENERAIRGANYYGRKARRKFNRA
jgi:hypothetical protein